MGEVLHQERVVERNGAGREASPVAEVAAVQRLDRERPNAPGRRSKLHALETRPVAGSGEAVPPSLEERRGCLERSEHRRWWQLVHASAGEPDVSVAVRCPTRERQPASVVIDIERRETVAPREDAAAEERLEMRARVATNHEYTFAFSRAVAPSDRDPIGSVVAGQANRARDAARPLAFEPDQADPRDRDSINGDDLELAGHEWADRGRIDTEVHEEAPPDDPGNCWSHDLPPDTCYSKISSIAGEIDPCQGPTPCMTRASIGR